jgi:hypothetical protein
VKARTAAWLAWSVWVATVILTACAIVLQTANRHAVPDLNDASLILVFLCFATVGAVIASRRGSNAVGWLCCVIGLTAFFGGFSEAYGRYAVTHPGSLPAAGAVAWPGSTWAWYATVGLVTIFLPLLFPTGHLPSSRWRPIIWAAGATLVAVCLASGATPGALGEGMPANPFPLQVAWAERLIDAVGLPVLGVLVLASAASVVVRFRRATEEERQQLKWFTYAAAILALGTAASAASPALDDQIPDVVSNLSLAAIPLAIGVAILRYRLYDIDRLINRTLVYGMLSVILALAYAAGVLVLGQLLGQNRSSLAVAGATLGVAGLFQPARRRVQDVVDRRFNRRRYDAATTVEAFSTRLRDQVDLDTLAAELLAVVDQTMEPTQASLWLRPSGSMAQERGDAVARPLASHFRP